MAELLFPTNRTESTETRNWRWKSYFALPLWATGSKIKFISGDWREIHLRLSLNRRTRNIVGTIFGGSIYSSVDPIYMLMWMKILGKDYIVWDKAASIRFLIPGKGNLNAQFLIDEEEIQLVKKMFTEQGEFDREYVVQFKNEDKKVVAEIRKTIYFANKEFYKKKRSKN